MEVLKRLGQTLASRLGSRKFVDVLFGGIAIVALKLGLSIPDELMYTLAGLIASLVFGVAWEDAAKNKAPQVSITDITNPSKN
jgi:hypothetical protein